MSWIIQITRLLLLFSILVLSSCKTNAIQPQENKETGAFNIGFSIQESPINIFRIEGVLDREGFESIIAEFTIVSDSAYAHFEKITVGIWKLSVTVYDSSNTAIYSGETNVEIRANLTTEVHLELQEITGDLIVVVTWNSSTEESGEFIYFASCEVQPRNVYRYNLQSMQLEKLTDVERTIYPIYLSNINKVAYLDHNVDNVWMMNTDGSEQTLSYSLPLAWYNPEFCSITNRIYFHTIESGLHNLASIDYNGNNFQYILQDVNYNDSMPNINSRGDSILFHTNRLGTYSVYLFGMDNSTISQVTDVSIHASQPHWSNSTNGFYFIEQDNIGKNGVSYFDLSTNNAHEIIKLQSLQIYYFDPSPDESKLALICADPAVSTRIRNLYVYDITSGILTPLTDDGLLYAHPHWYDF